MLRLACILAALAGATTIHAQTSPIRTGTYDLEIAFGGGVLKGALTLRKVADSLGAQLQVGDHQSPVHAKRPQGNRLILEGSSGVQVRYQLDFKEDDLSGSFIYEGETGSVTGKRRRSTGD